MITVMLPACGGAAPKSESPLRAPTGVEKLDGIRDAINVPTRTKIGDLILLLESDDPLTRSAAIYALRQITGETMGFVADDEIDDRRYAVSKWQAWLDLQPEGANTWKRATGGTGPSGGSVHSSGGGMTRG